ncbi:uncharacterized protein LOC118414942 [Branchiostoma floridae]|uniref:Uncharacterized protein LOC118414942 n=1 Tax=Branchiostoma floridae TaxID=7739 RepID=A0A9J7L2Y8_BRAFL|nr:uncharacterized protein LOC118414942 [Branchiostoma floridae]
MIMASVSCKHGSWGMILLITLHFSSQGGATSCYKGIIEDGTDNPDFPVVKQCDVREKRDSPLSTSLSPTSSVEPNVTEPSHTTAAPAVQSTTKKVPTSPTTTNQPTPPLSTRAPADAQMCLRFAVQKTSGSLKFGKAVEWKVKYGCDTDNLCQGKTGTFDHKVTWHGESGTLYCCNSDNCNSPVVQSCYNGEIGKKRLVQATCLADSKFCVSSLDHVNGTVVGGQYSCSMVEYRDVCVRNGFSEPGCKNVTGPSGKLSTVCCCNTNNCNIPINITSPVSPTTRSPSVHPKHHGSHSVNYAVPTAATVIIILVILTAVGGLCVWKKKRETGSGALSFTYSRLAADVAV